MIVAYVRVSTREQNPNLQKDALLHYGAEKIFEETMSASATVRPVLDQAIRYLRSGDTFVVWKLDRLGRTAKQLIDLMEQFRKDQIQFVSLQEQIDTVTPMGAFFFVVMAGLAQMERDILIERTRAGLLSARKRGRVGGRPPLDQKKVKQAIKLYHTGQFSIPSIVQMTGVSKSSLYHYLKQQKSSQNLSS